MDTDQNKIKEMQALISLLDEPDPEIYRDIAQNVHAFGPDIIPFLEHAWESQHIPEIQERIEILIHQIQYDRVCEELLDWKEKGANDLLEGCLIIARYQFPTFEEDIVFSELSRLQREIWIELNENLTALEQIKVFNHIFYDVMGFQGNTAYFHAAHFHAPNSSYINKVLESRKGNPLSLSIIYMLIAQDLDLPVVGINLPEHFVLAYTAPSFDPETMEYNKDSILFYINAFSRGTVFSQRDLDIFLKQIKQEPRAEFFEACSNNAIIVRMLHNLVNAYQKKEETGKVKEIQHLLSILNK